ncbi:MAG: hypothetical protein ACFFBE_10880 [Promethearchaeota archaeon]
MTEEHLKNKIKELRSEIQLKNKEISDHLDKIDYLEDMIMEIEASLTKKEDEKDSSLLNIQLKDLHERNRELKNKISSIRLENIKLKQELEKIKKGFFDKSSLIQVVESKVSSNESKPINIKKTEVSEDYTFEHELFNYVQINCPMCEKEKSLKIPMKIINQNLVITTINIPKGMICEHSFQVLIDKSYKIRRYQLIDYEFHLLEFSQNIDKEVIAQKDDDITSFISLPFYQDILNIFRESIDEREVLGTAIFTGKGKVIYASVPSNMLFNIIKEFEFRNERQLQAMTKMYIEMNNSKKIFSEYIQVLDIYIIFVIIFSERVNFATGTMIFRDLLRKVETITKN